MWHAWNLPLEDLAEVLVYRSGSKTKARDLLTAAPSVLDAITARDCDAYFEMYKMISAPGEPRTPTAAASLLADKCAEHLRESFAERWRKGFAEYEETGGPEVWVRTGRVGELVNDEPFKLTHFEMSKRREAGEDLVLLHYVVIPDHPWEPWV